MKEILNTIQEIWKPIINYEGLYEISNYGRVKSFLYYNGTDERILKPKRDKRNYLHVILSKDDKHKSFQVHRLVLETFVGPCPEGKEGCHNNGNPSDNFVGNLRWDTHSNNEKDKRLHGTKTNPIWLDNCGSKNPFAKLNDIKVLGILKLLYEGILTGREIAKLSGVSEFCISGIKRNKTWKHLSREI